MKEKLEKIKASIVKYFPKLKVIGKTISTGFGEMLKTTEPATAVPLEIAKQIFSGLSEFQLHQIIRGLEESKNVEKRLNQLYTYSRKPEGMSILSKLTEQAVGSASTITLVILGIMLSDLAEKNTNPTFEDTIVMGALKNATDYEIKYMREIYTKHVDSDGYINENKIEQSSMIKEYNRTLEWGISNRVIGKVGHRRIDEFELDLFGEFMIVNECTQKLMYYVEKARQVLAYGGEYAC